MTPLIRVGFLEAKIESYDCKPLLYSQGGGGHDAPETDPLRISHLQLSSVLHVTLLTLLRGVKKLSQD